MARFAELLDAAIAHADSRDQLTSSRARLVTEADDAPAFFSSVFLLAIDSDPGRSVPNWSFYAKSEVGAPDGSQWLPTTLVRGTAYA